MLKQQKKKMKDMVEQKLRDVIKERTNKLVKQLKSIDDEDEKLLIFNNYLERKEREEKEIRLKQSTSTNVMTLGAVGQGMDDGNAKIKEIEGF
jgi:hypothetical protein